MWHKKNSKSASLNILLDDELGSGQTRYVSQLMSKNSDTALSSNLMRAKATLDVILKFLQKKLKKHFLTPLAS